MAKYANFLNLWRDFHKLAKTAKATSNSLTNVEKGCYYWLGDGTGGGGALSKKAAYSLAKYLKDGIRSSRFDDRIARLSDSWKAQKYNEKGWRWKGKRLFMQRGMATGALVNSITALDYGGGRWGVGIPSIAQKHVYSDSEYAGIKVGSISNIYKYASIFEFGALNRPQPQPARPIFAVGFLRWTKEEMPALVSVFKKTFATEIDKLSALWKAETSGFTGAEIPGVISSGFQSEDPRAQKAFADVEQKLHAESRMRAKTGKRVTIVKKEPDLVRGDPSKSLAPEHYEDTSLDKLAVKKFDTIPGYPKEMYEGYEYKMEGTLKMLKHYNLVWNAEDERWQTLADYTERLLASKRKK